MFMNATVISIDPRGLLVRDSATGQEVFVNFNNPNAFSPGDLIRISYNGMMTRSIPPQISATSIRRVTATPPPQTTPSEIRRAVVLQVRNNSLIIRDPGRNNQQATVNYQFAYHFCVGQRVNIQYETVFLGNQGQLTINATDISPVC